MKEYIIQYLKNITNSYIFIKCIVIFICSVIAFIPTEMFTVIYYLANPIGFWQNFALFSVGILVLGLPQLFLGYLYVIAILLIIAE